MKFPDLRSANSQNQASADRYRYLRRKKPPFPQFFLPLLLGSTVILGGLAAWFFSGKMVILGVPSSIILTFLQDEVAFDAYLRGDASTLHDRLQLLGVEEQIKDFYRPQFSNEAALDQHIHQLMYENTGYVGKDYRVDSRGILVLKQSRQ